MRAGTLPRCADSVRGGAGLWRSSGAQALLLPVAVGGPGLRCRPAPEGFGPFGQVREATRRRGADHIATAVRERDLPRETLDLMEEMAFRGEEEGVFVPLPPFPALLLGTL